MRLKIICALVATLAFCSLALAESRYMLPGGPFPKLELQTLVAPEDYKLLNLQKTEGKVELNEIGKDGDILVLDFFNRYCFTCINQSVAVENFRKSLFGTDLENRVFILGIGAGNNSDILKEFRKEQNIAFAMAPDPFFDHYYGLDRFEGAPTTVFLRKKDGKWIYLDKHLGSESETQLMARTRILIDGKEGPMTGFVKKPERAPTVADYLTKDQIEDYAKSVLAKATGKKPKVLKLASEGRELFEMIDDNGKPTGIYAGVASREAVCDLCHSTVFALAMDAKGQVLAFIPVYATKFGNEIWDEADKEKIAKRLVGRGHDDLIFVPDVDSVTSATISSSLIFDEARRMGEAILSMKK